MIVKKLIDRVQTLYSKGVKSDDSRLSNRYIYNKLMTVRSKLVSQQYKKKQAISQWNYQTLPCIKLIRVPAHQCPCLPPMGCDILRSEHKLPEPIMGFTQELIQNVTSIDRQIKINRVTLNAVNAQKGNKYTSNKVTYFTQDGYIYVITPNNIGVISLSGLFEDPLEAEAFKGYCDDCETCGECIDYLNQDFPIDGDMIDTLVELTKQEVIGQFSQAIEDTTNNTRDSLKEQSK